MPGRCIRNTTVLRIEEVLGTEGTLGTGSIFSAQHSMRV